MIAAEVAVPKVKGEGVTDKLKELKLSPVSTVDAAVGGNKITASTNSADAGAVRVLHRQG